MSIRRFVLSGLTWLLVATGAKAQSVAGGEVTQTIAVVQQSDLRIDLKVARKASLAARDWLALEFRNQGTEPLVLKNAYYRIESERDNLKTGRPIGTGGLASGTFADLFPDDLRIGRPRASLQPAPGRYRVAEHPSDYSASLLGLPSHDGWRVRARLFLHVDLADGRQFETPVAGLPFAFDWIYPDQAGFPTLRRQLLQLLAEPEQKIRQDYLLNTLLEVAEVARATGREELLGGLERRRSGTYGRSAIVRALAKHFPTDPVVLNYFRERLKAGDERVLADLNGMPLLDTPAVGLWDRSFMELLVRLYEADPLKFDLALRVLHQHRNDWVNDGRMPRRLSTRVRRAYPVLDQGLGEHSAADGDDKLKELELVGRWTRGVSALGLTGDPSVIPVLRPALQDRYAIERSNGIAFGGKRMPPLRVCDWALEAILTLLDGSPDAAYRQTMVGPRNVWAKPGDDAAWADIRDAMIARLEKRLQAR